MSDQESSEIPSSVVGARKRADLDSLNAQLAALSEMDAPELRAEWRRLYRSHPPRLLRRDLLELGVAWKLQERVLGGLSAATKRQLAELDYVTSSEAAMRSLAENYTGLPVEL